MSLQRTNYISVPMKEKRKRKLRGRSAKRTREKGRVTFKEKAWRLARERQGSASAGTKKKESRMIRKKPDSKAGSPATGGIPKGCYMD